MTRRVSDRDRRLIRSRAMLASAIEILSHANHDIWVVSPRLGVVLDKRTHSLKWLVKELGRELDKEPEEGGG